MKNLKLKVSITVVFVISFLLLGGCSNLKLSEDFNEDEVRQKSEEVIEIINNNDSDALIGMCTIEMKKALDEDTLASIYEAIDEGGSFKEIKDLDIGGNKDKKTEEEYAVAVVKTEYENKNFIYTISFTKQMKLAGFYYK